jgi:hypothetical protein
MMVASAYSVEAAQSVRPFYVATDELAKILSPQPQANLSRRPYSLMYGDLRYFGARPAQFSLLRRSQARSEGET